MTHRKIKRTLTGTCLEGITGAGSEIAFNITACRTTKAGTYEHYELELKARRYVVRRLLNQLKEMHERDRARLVEETNRIAIEMNILQVSP